MRKGLPQGWISVELENHVYIAGRIGWRGLKRSEYTKTGPLFLSVKNILSNGQINYSETDHISRERYDESPEIQLQPGDILLTKDGTIGKVGMVASLPTKTTVNSSILVVRPNDELLLKRYLFHFLRGPQFQAIARERITGSAIPHLFQKDIKKLWALVPPKPEQKRIIEKLETLLGKVDSCQTRLTTIATVTKRFRQSVLAAACSGRLTENWRKKYPKSALVDKFLAGFASSPQKQTCDAAWGTPDNWKWVRFKFLLTSIRGGSTFPPHTERSHYPVLRSSSVRPGTVDFSDVRYLTKEQSFNADNFLANGDMLFTRLSGSLEYVANCAVVRNLGRNRIQYPDRLFCARLKEPLMASYLEICFANPILREKLTENAKSSAGHQRVSISDITNQCIPLPSLEEQREIVLRVNKLFALADHIEARYSKAKVHVERISQSILAKAFRGELVPQDPKNEPASVLLGKLQLAGKQLPSKQLRTNQQKARKKVTSKRKA